MPVFFEDNNVHTFYNALSISLNSELVLLREVFFHRRNDTRRRLFENIMHNVAQITGNAVNSLFPTPVKIDEVLDAVADRVFDTLSQRTFKKSRLHNHILSKTPKELEGFIEHTAYEITIAWSPSILWLAKRIPQVSNFDPKTRMALLGHIAALRVFETLIDLENDSLSLNSPSDIIASLIESRSGRGHQSLFNNALTFNILGDGVRFTAEGFFEHAAFTFDQKYFAKNQGTILSKRHIKFDWSLCNRNDPFTNLVPKYGYIQVPTSHLVNKYGFIDQKISRRVTEQNPAYFVAKSQHRLVTIDLLKQYLEYLNDHEQISFTQWLIVSYPENYSVTPESLTVVFRGEINGNQLENLDLSKGIFSGADFSHCTFRDCTLGDFTNARLVRCGFYNVKAHGDVLNNAVLDYSTIESCDMQNLTIHRELSLREVEVTNSNFSGFNPGRLAEIRKSEAYFDDFTLNTLVSDSGNSNRVENRALANELNSEASQKLLLVQSQYDDAIRSLENRWQHREADIANIKEALRAADEMTLRLFRVEQEGAAANEAIDELKHAQREMLENIHNKLDHYRRNIAPPGDRPGFLNVEQILAEQQYNPDLWSKLPRQLSISTKGEDGQHGQNGENGNEGSGYGDQGGDGGDGADGQDGSNAEPIDVTMQSIPEEGMLYIREDHNNIDPSLMTLTSGSSIVLNASGGDAGNGGSGGHGGKGSIGQRGEDANRSRNGGNGGNGGDGGHAGRPGRAGKAGNGSNITVKVEEDDSYLLSLIKTTKVAAGKTGVNGQPGLGGQGGYGGSGGASYTYSESFRQSDGTTTTRSFTNPGGTRGTDGRKGRDASKISSIPKSAVPGRLQFKLFRGDYSQPKIYKSIYRPVLLDANFYGSPDGIIEPGEVISAHGIRIVNRSDMPTPPTGMSIGVKSNALVAFDDKNNSILYKDSLLHNVEKTFSETLPIQIRDNVFNPGERPLKLETDLLFRTLIEPIKAPMECFEAESSREKSRTKIQVRYPVEMSTAASAQVIMSGYQIPIYLMIRNISANPVGVDSNTPRLVNVLISLDNNTAESSSGFYFSSANENEGKDFSFESAVNYEVRNLKPGKTAHLAGVIKAENPTIASYSRIRFSFELEIGEHGNQPHKTKVIQKNGFELQLAEAFDESLEHIDILLLTNSQTTAATVNDWRSTASRLGLQLAVYNVGFYGGFSYFDEKFKNKINNAIVVVLNNSFKHPLTGENSLPMDLINHKEIMAAKIQMSVKTLIIGGEVDFQKLLTVTPFREEPETYQSRREFLQYSDELEEQQRNLEEGIIKLGTHVTCPYGSNPAPHMVRQKAEKVLHQLSKRHPERWFAAGMEFSKQREGNRFGIFKRYSTGDISLMCGLPVRTSGIAHVPTQLDSSKHFILIKLLPFETKLSLLDSMVDDAVSASIIGKVVLSDLADEYYNFAITPSPSLFSFNNALTLPIVKSRLDSFNQFSNQLSRIGLESHQNRNEFINILVHMRWLATQSHARSDLSDFYREWANEKIWSLTGGNSLSEKRSSRRMIQESLNLPRTKSTGVTFGWRMIKDITNFTQENNVRLDTWDLLNKLSVIMFDFDPGEKIRSSVDIDLFKLSGDKEVDTQHSQQLTKSGSALTRQSFFHYQSDTIRHHFSKDASANSSAAAASDDAQGDYQLRVSGLEKGL